MARLLARGAGGSFSLFLGEGGVSFSLFLFLLGLEGVSQYQGMLFVSLESENCS